MLVGFLAFAFGIVLFSAVRSVVEAPTESGEWSVLLVGLLLAGGFYTVALWGFARVARKAERFLDDLFAKHLRQKTRLDP